jgi:hypothetical protein
VDGEMGFGCGTVWGRREEGCTGMLMAEGKGKSLNRRGLTRADGVVGGGVWSDGALVEAEYAGDGTDGGHDVLVVEVLMEESVV